VVVVVVSDAAAVVFLTILMEFGPE